MTIPPDAIARVEQRLRSLKPGEAAELVLTFAAYRHRNGVLDVKARVDLDELFEVTHQMPLDIST